MAGRMLPAQGHTTLPAPSGDKTHHLFGGDDRLSQGYHPKELIMETTTIWKSGHAFSSHYKSHTIETDGNGFSPKALLLTGLAGCSGIDLVDLMEKMRVPFGSVEILVKTEQTEEHPRVFKDIHVVYRVQTGEENRDKVKKAIDLSLEKYCGVAAMLQKNSRIAYTIDLIGV